MKFEDVFSELSEILSPTATDDLSTMLTFVFLVEIKVLNTLMGHIYNIFKIR